ncbi:18648_t:CDS:2 [Funneliformis geosporum]|uniref:13850_t:CDS:1 n=1 Tax=Funneliformis geosporum TaxID=1117311 RepID=A0A9W4WIH4_9GLOM|nr:18648_t:CDS:2 [Funneliformis geosporum]CAI2164225.1 13850_t:CDS:2 [Funneliformis geosporum]
MQVDPDYKGKSNMVDTDDAKRFIGTDKWMVSVVVEQGRIISKFDYKMTAYDPQTFRAFFEPVKETKPMRLYASPSKRQRPQIISITLLEFNQGRITAEEQISLHPLSFSVDDPGTFCLFRDRSFWHMYVQVGIEDHSYEFNKRRDPQRWVTPLGFEVEVDMDLSEKKSSEFAEPSHNDKRNDKNKKNEAAVNEKSNRDSPTPPPMARSTSSFPFHNRTFTEWCVNKPPKWKRKLKKIANNVRHAFNRTRF